jgi:signal transduction histidine kinase
VKTAASYPFYSSLKFRFGLIFGFAFMCFLLIIGFMLHSSVKKQFERSFAAKMKTQGNLILQETEINPLTIPFPASGEYFRLIYDANNKHDTLFDNLPASLKNSKAIGDVEQWRMVTLERSLETGAVIRVLYVLSATELIGDIRQLQTILFLYFPLAFLTALALGYLLSGFLLRPIESIIKKSNEISLQGQIYLLEEPAVHDELHQLAVSLNRMLSQIQKQARDQNAFFASASHELRTPLSVMLTELQTLQNDQIPGTIEPVIKNQIAEVQRLSKLVNDFLLLSQLKSGELILKKTNVNLAEITVELLERFNAQALNNAQTFKIQFLPEDGEFEIYTDKSHLVTMLLNLLENVVKHGRSNSLVHIGIEKVNKDISLTIRNSSKTDIEDTSGLLQEFNRKDLSTDGFGLGLWIVARLAETVGIKFEARFARPDFTARLLFLSDTFVRQDYGTV